MIRKLAGCMGLIAVVCALSGCHSARPASALQNQSPPAIMVRAEQLLADRQYTEAILCCIELARRDPLTPGLAKLQNKIQTRMAEEQALAAAFGEKPSVARMHVDIERSKVLPGTYGLRIPLDVTNAPIKTVRTPAEVALEKKVTLHLDGVNLNDFVLAVGKTEGINIVADAGTGSAATMTVHAENVPLQEILDFVSRNLGIAFFVGENIIWATKQTTTQDGIPLEMRMYRLKKGVSIQELDKAGKINVVQAIERFIPKVNGSDILFDQKAHVVLVKNTRENLAKVESIIEELDVCPPQILIEARFITVGASDLRELGIDWVLKSPLVISEKMVLKNGVREPESKMQVKEGATAGFTGFPGSAQGLNFTYQGLLTQPTFEAILHALETSGKSQTLSVPKVTTVNNHMAMIRIGEDFRYFDQFDVQSIPSSVSTAGNTVYSTMLVPVGSPKLEELGIQLSVTPSVGADMRSITLNLLPDISEFVRYETYQVGIDSGAAAAGGVSSSATTSSTSVVKIPIFRRNKIETEVVVQSGETVVMGGLVTFSEDKSRDSIPFISAIPIIGRLFSHDTVDSRKQNLLIFVTATLISERGEDLLPVVGRLPEKTGANAQSQPDAGN